MPIFGEIFKMCFIYMFYFLFLKKRKPGLLSKKQPLSVDQEATEAGEMCETSITDYLHKSPERCSKGRRRLFSIYQIGKHFKVKEATNGEGARKPVCTVNIF